MSKMSDYLEKKLLDHVLRGVTYTPPANVYVALYTSDPTDTGAAGTEVSGGSYARQVVTFSAATNPGGACLSDIDVTFPVAAANWGTVTHVSLMDAPTGGNELFHGALTAAQVINSGNQFKIPLGQLAVTLA